jgi:hypothetical protein
LSYSIEKAAKLLNVNIKKLQEFNVIDTFNNNEISGYISLQPDYRYGAMVIYAVNEKQTSPQIIYGTPKINYPEYSVENSKVVYTFQNLLKPDSVKRIQVYEKLDGTAVCAYSYSDSKGKRYISFKLRLTPVIKNNKFYPLYDLWKTVMERYPYVSSKLYGMEQLIEGRISLTFEMWGSSLTHLIKYQKSLYASLLFGVNQETAGVIPASYFDNLLNPLRPRVYGSNFTDIDKLYNECRDNNTATQNSEGFIIGSEGYVFYIYTDRGWLQYKNKPPIIEEIHRRKSIISKYDIQSTVQNLVESEELTIPNLTMLLEEEYTREIITNSFPNILEVYREMKVTLKFFDTVSSAYDRNCKGLSCRRDIMAKMSEYFPSNKMRMVYSYLSSHHFWKGQRRK